MLEIYYLTIKKRGNTILEEVKNIKHENYIDGTIENYMDERVNDQI